jgi:glycosyltransferase involved in cell wall biosynthesis
MVRTVAQIEAEQRSSGGLSYAPRPRRVGIVADYLEERWPSMDLAAELTSLAVARHGAGAFLPAILRPRLPRLPGGRAAPEHGTRNVDRYLGRYLAYPRWLRGRARGLDLFHVIDQSYAHLVHALPARQTVVTCHDLDVFRSILGDEREPRPLWFRATMKRVLSGLRAAAHVICDSQAVRDALHAHAGIPAERLTVAALPVHPDFTTDADGGADARAAELLGPVRPEAAELLHVGATVPRKNLPFVLEVFAAVRQRHPHARLVRVGGEMTGEQRALAERLGVRDAVVELPFIDRPTLAAVYRRSGAVLLPSEREGFGWPVLEALACGTPVVASDALPSVREIGGEVVSYAPAGGLPAWADAVDRLLRVDPGERSSRRQAARERAAAFSIEAYAAAVLPVYRRVLGIRTE